MKQKTLENLSLIAMSILWTSYILAALIISVPVLLVAITTIILQALTPRKNRAQPTTSSRTEQPHDRKRHPHLRI